MSIFPIVSQLIFSMQCKQQQSTNNNMDDDCSNDHITANASYELTLILTASNIAAIFMAGNYGHISNIVGRRYTAMIPFMGSMCYACACIYVALVRPDYYLAILVVFNFVDGFCGMHSALAMCLFAYVADTFTMKQSPSQSHTSSSPSSSASSNLSVTHKSHAFSVLGVSILIANITAPFVCGILTTQSGSYLYALSFGVVLYGCGLCWVTWMLPPDDIETQYKHKYKSSQTRTQTRTQVHDLGGYCVVDGVERDISSNTNGNIDVDPSTVGLLEGHQQGQKQIPSTDKSESRPDPSVWSVLELDVMRTFKNIYWIVTTPIARDIS